MGARDPTEDTVQEVLRQTEIEKQDVDMERTKRRIREIKEDLNDDAVQILADIIKTRQRAERIRSKAIAAEMML